jgi:cell division protein FtsL
MKRLTGTSLVALATALLLASLTLVARRQAQALEELDLVDELRREWSLEIAEQEDLQNRIRQLESRGRILAEAEERLGMRKAAASDIVFLSGGGS